MLCWTRQVSIWFLQNIASPVVGVLNSISFGQLGYLQGDVSSAVTAIETNVPCTPKTLWSCNLFLNDTENLPTHLPMPTRCWAGAEPEIGGSLACTIADTCIQESDYSNLLCANCPRASGMTQFGCDTLTKLCTCNIFPVGISACSTHQECMLDDNDVECQYVDSYLQTSYGNVPCTQCPSPICLITDGSGKGQCSCLLRPVPTQACSGVGQIVSPDAGYLCLLASAGTSVSTSNEYSTDYQNLASVPCMLLNQAQTYCMSVFVSGTTSSQLVVGLALLSRRRTLLTADNTSIAPMMTNESAWLGRGEPCRTLVRATSGLGLLEQYTRGECWRWYGVGIRLISETNMTGIVSPYLFVSWADLVDVLLNKRAFVELMAKLPAVVHRALLHSEFAQPIYLVLAYWASKPGIWLNQSLLDNPRELLINTTAQPGRRLLYHAAPHAARRHLTQQVIDTSVSSETVYEWGEGPFSWPPNFVYWNDGDRSCAAVSTALDVIENAFKPTVQFYQQQTAPEPLPLWWPPVPTTLPNRTLALMIPTVTTDINSLTAWTAAALANVTDVWLDRDASRTFLGTAPYMDAVYEAIRCNFTRIQTCAERRSLIDSALQTALLALLLIVLGKLLQIPYTEVLTMVAFVPALLYNAYGYAPLCAPLIPTCALSDILAIVTWFLPPTIEWPAPLLVHANCSSPECIRSCRSDPTVGFASVYDHMAWIMCEIDPQWATSTVLSSPFVTGSPLRIAVLRKCALDNSDPMRSAQRICFTLTLVYTAPIVLLCFAAAWLLSSLSGLAITMIQFAVNFMFTFVMYIHSND